MSSKRIIVTACILGMLAVIAGAFGSHGLKGSITASQMEAWQTGVQYQFYHAFALLFLTTITRFKSKLIKHAYYLFTIGTVFFSGSLYLLASAKVLGWTWIAIVWPLTPIGGLMFIAGWCVFAYATYKVKAH